MSTRPLRILLILETGGAGSGRHVIDLARGLLDRGNSVTLVYSTARIEDWFADAIRDLEGLETHCVPMVRSPGPSDLVSLARIRSFMAGSTPPWDVVHGHSSKGGALARLAGLFSSAASVYTPHALVTLDPELRGPKRWMYASIERMLGGISDGIICVSRAERDHAQTLGIAPEKLTVIENCLVPLPAPNRPAARAELGLQEDEVCIGFVGRLAPQKNIGRLLEAFARLRPQAPAAKLVIVGDGPDDSMLRDTAKRLDIEDGVTWTGHADGQALMAAFDIFALPSDYEAFPYVLLEAAARALPIVSTRVGGAEDVIEDGVNGYVVDNGEALCERLLEVVRDTDMRSAMGQASLARSGDFNVDRMVSETLGFYHELVD